VSWFRPTPQEQTEARLLAQWRRGRLQRKLSELPLELFLWLQCRRLKKTRAAGPAKTGSRPDRPQRRSWMPGKIPTGIKCLARQLNPLRCLQRPRLVQARRRLLVLLLVLLVRFLRLLLPLPRWFRGIRARCARFSSS